MVRNTHGLKKSDFNTLYKASLHLANKGKYEEALKYLDTALKINPIHLDASNLKIGILKELRRDEEASKYISEDFIIRMDLTDKDADFWSMKGKIFMIDKKYKEAIICFEKALKLDSSLFGCENERQKAIKLLSKEKI